MRYVLIVLVLVLLVATLWTAVTQVQPGERAVVRRFGRILDDKPGPGLHIGLPWGLDRVDRIAVNRVRRVTINSVEKDDRSPFGQLITGDHNLIIYQAEIDYRVIEDQVEKFVVQADQAETLIGRAAETALAEWVAGRDVDTVLLRGKAQLPTWLVAQVQKRLEGYGLGIQIEKASVPQLAPPDEVRKAFEDVARAQAEMSTKKNQAEQRADQIRRTTQSDMFAIERQTASFVLDQRLQARAEKENFEKRLEQYRDLRTRNPQYLAGVWWDEMTRLYGRMRENGRIDLLDHYLSGDGLNITQMPLLPRKK